MSEAEMRGSYLLIKTSLVVFNGAQIFQCIFSLAMIYNKIQLQDISAVLTVNGTTYEQSLQDSQDTKQMLLMPFYVSTILLVLLYLVGIYGAIREHKRILMSYGLILAVLAFFQMFSPHFRLSIWIIKVVMASLAIGFSMMIQFRAAQLQQLYALPKV